MSSSLLVLYWLLNVDYSLYQLVNYMVAYAMVVNGMTPKNYIYHDLNSQFDASSLA